MHITTVRNIAAASLIGWSVLPMGLAWAEEPKATGSAAPTTEAITVSIASPRDDGTPAEHLERLRIGLERLALKYPTRESHMAQLRSGLERMAKDINARAN